MSSSSDESPTQQQHQEHRVSHLVESIFAYNSNVMLAALISLLLVILFVLLLHVYARCFLNHAHSQAHHRRRRRTFSSVLGPSAAGFNHNNNNHHNHNSHPISPSFLLDLSSLSASASASKGLDISAISAIPLFVYDGAVENSGLECVVCLSGFDDGEVGRHLPKCGHEFHVECIDMWLGSHSNCPICRAPAVSEVNSIAGDACAMEEMTGDGDSVVVVDVSSSGDNGESSVGNDSSPPPPPPPQSPSSSSFGCSLKRMLSRNCSESKVFPASSVSELAT